MRHELMLQVALSKRNYILSRPFKKLTKVHLAHGSVIVSTSRSIHGSPYDPSMLVTIQQQATLSKRCCTGIPVRPTSPLHWM